MVVVNDDGGQDQGWGQDTHFGKEKSDILFSEAFYNLENIYHS